MARGFRLVFLILGMLCAGLSLTSCAQPTAPAEPTTLKIGVLPITDVVPMYVAQAEDYFEAEGIQVELVPVASGTERDSLIQAEGIDGELNEILTTLLTNAGEGADVKIVTSALHPFPSEPMFYIVAGPQSGITGPADLRGVEIGSAENTVIQYVAERLLEHAGVAPDEVRFTNVPKIPVRFELLMNGQLPAGVLPDPLASLAQLQGGRVVLDDTSRPDVSLSVISFRTEVLKDRPNTIRAFLRAYDKAVAAINAHPEQYEDILIQTARVPEALQGKYTLPTFPEKEIPSQAQVEDVVKWAMAKGLISQPPAYDDLVDASFR